MQRNEIHKSRNGRSEKARNIFGLLSESIRSTMLLMLMLGRRSTAERERRKDGLTSSELVCHHCGGSRLYAAELSTMGMTRTTRTRARSKVVKVFTRLFHGSPLCKQSARHGVLRFPASGFCCATSPAPGVTAESNYNQMTDPATFIRGTMTRKARHDTPPWIPHLQFSSFPPGYTGGSHTPILTAF